MCGECATSGIEQMTVRRRFLFRSVLGLPLAGVLAPTFLSRVHAHEEEMLAIVQPVKRTPEAFMARADEMRKLAVKHGDQSFGAVVVKASEIVGLGPSRVITNQDPTAHAEMEALRDAARRLATRNLSGCTLYTTYPPCRMCETAAYWANVSAMVSGATLTEHGSPQYGGCP